MRAEHDEVGIQIRGSLHDHADGASRADVRDDLEQRACARPIDERTKLFRRTRELRCDRCRFAVVLGRETRRDRVHEMQLGVRIASCDATRLLQREISGFIELDGGQDEVRALCLGHGIPPTTCGASYVPSHAH